VALASDVNETVNSTASAAKQQNTNGICVKFMDRRIQLWGLFWERKGEGGGVILNDRGCSRVGNFECDLLKAISSQGFRVFVLSVVARQLRLCDSVKGGLDILFVNAVCR
jgi:hypothetical protein